MTGVIRGVCPILSSYSELPNRVGRPLPLAGVTLDISPLMRHPAVKAILHAGQPSVNSLGVADVLFGRRVPAGRTVTTMMPAAFGMGLPLGLSSGN